MQSLILKIIFTAVTKLIGSVTKEEILKFISTAEETLTDSYIRGEDKKSFVLKSIKSSLPELLTKFKSFILSMIVDILVAEFKSKESK